MEDEKKQIDSLWMSKRRDEKELEQYRKELKEAEEDKDDVMIDVYKKLIEETEENIKSLNESIEELLESFLDKKKNEKKGIKSKTKNTTKANMNESSSNNKKRNFDKAKLIFDLSKGEYRYDDIDGYNFVMPMFDENGKEILTKEDKKNIVRRLLDIEIDERTAKKVDPYIYDLLEMIDEDKKLQYIEAIKNKLEDIEDIDILYDLRTREDGKKRKKEVKLSFLQNRKIKKIAKFHGKRNLATVMINKSKAKLYGLLAGIGVMSLVAGNKTIEYINTNNNQIERETENGFENDDEPIIIIYDENQETIYNESETDQHIEEMTEIETEQYTESIMGPQTEIEEQDEVTEAVPNEQKKQEEISETIKAKQDKVDSEVDVEPSKPRNETGVTETSKSEDSEVQEKEYKSMVGKRVKVEIGTHEYNDPTDAIKEQLNLQTQNEVITKQKNKDLVYRVTKEGLYCPDGSYAETKDGQDLITAMKQKGIDENILKNIGEDDLIQQGYKYMLHVEADGIQVWVEADSTVEVDRAGIPIPSRKDITQNNTTNNLGRNNTESLER